jgi:WD40 repeat protein/tetratricopeptide (TPR) repeat protein
MSRAFVCPQGHTWALSPEASAPLTAEPKCPVCGAAPRAPGAPKVAGYHLLRELGRGRTGVVYHAWQLLHGREAALKMIGDEALGGSHDLVRFCTDGRAAAKLSHPGIVAVYEAGDSDGDPYLAAAYVPGVTLQRRIADAPLPPPEAARLVEALARAVHHAHEHHVHHFGLTPANVFLDGHGSPRLADFGLAVFLGQPGRAFPGNSGYAAAEQAAGLGAAGPATDVYGLGAVLYAALTGLPPFLAATPAETLEQVRTRPPLPPSQRRPDVPAALEYICLKCLRKRPGRRYPSALALAEDLQGLEKGHAPAPRPVLWADRLGRWVRRQPAAIGAAAVAFLLIAAALGLAVRGYQSATQARADAEQQRQLAIQHSDEAARARTEAEGAGLLAQQRARQAEMDGQEAARQRDEMKQKLTQAEALRRESLRAKDQEVEARKRSEDRAREADDARQLADGRRADAARLLARAYAAAGTRVLDGGDLAGALPWFTEALRVAKQERLPEEAHRLRLAALLGECPRPTQFWLHAKGISQVRLSPDGRQVLTTGADGALRLWDPATGKAVGKPLLHGVAVRLVEFAPDGKRVATADANQAVHVWDLGREEEVFPAFQLPGPVVALTFSPDGRRLLTVGHKSPEDLTEPEVRLWDAATAEAVGQALGSQVAPRPVAFSPDGKHVLTVCLDNCARAWDVTSGNQVGASLTHTGAVSSASYAADGRHLVTGSADGTARVWDAATGKPVTAPLRHGAGVLQASFSPDGGSVLTAGEDHTVRLWDAVSGAPSPHALRLGEPLLRAAFSPDGRHVAAAGDGGTVWLFDGATGSDLLPPLRHTSAVRELAFAAVGAGLLTFDGRAVRLWDLTAGEPLPPPGKGGSLTAATFSPDGKRLVRLDGKTAQVHDTATGKPVGEPMKHQQAVRSAAFSPDGKRLLTVSEPAEEGGAATPVWRVRLWDAETGKPVAGPLEHLRAVTDTAFSPDGTRVATACGDKKLRVWDAATGAMVGKEIDHNQDLTRALFTPDGKRVVSLDAEGTVRIWDYATGDRIGEGFGHVQGVNHIAFRPDGARVVTSSDDGTAIIWDATTGRPVGEPLAHVGPVVHASFSPDGKYVATASRDRTARVWDGATGKPITPPLRHDTAVALTAFSPDGRWLATAAGSRVRVWEVATGEPVTPPLRHTRAGRPVTFLALEVGGRLVAAGGLPGDPSDRWARVLRPDDRPVEELELLARLLSGERAGPGGPVPVGPEEVGAAWKALQDKSAGDFAPPKERLRAWEWRAVAECEGRGAWGGAVLHLGRLIAAAPSGDLYARRARALSAQRRWDRALQDYGKAIEADGTRAEWWAGRADVAAGLRRWDDAVADYSKALELQRDDPALALRRGRTEAERGKWERAAADLAAAGRARPNDLDLWHQQALALLAAGKRDDYRRLCARMAKRFGARDEAAFGLAVARTCTLAPDALPDMRTLVRRAERAVTADPASVAGRRRLAALQYRAGQFEPALKHLQDLTRISGPTLEARDWLLLAMACQRLKKDAEGKAGLERADKAKPGDAAPWDRRLEYRLLRVEADELLKKKP